MGPCCNAGWVKLDKYYGLTEQSAAYVTAVVLDCSQKWDHFEDQWSTQPDWLPANQRIVEGVWISQYKATSEMVDEEFTEASLSSK